MITGAQAAQYNLVNRAVPENSLNEEVKELANGLALHPKDGIAMGKVTREMMYTTMGIDRGLVDHYIMHTVQTNRVLEPGEVNFFKMRRDKGVRSCSRKTRHFKALDEFEINNNEIRDSRLAKAPGLQP